MSNYEHFQIPKNVPISSIYLDESGSRNSSGGFFVVGFIKVREPASLARTIRDIRQKHNFYTEMHFSKISQGKLRFFYDIVEELAAADIRLGGSVYDSKSFTSDKETWQQQADMATQLVKGNINKGELVNVFLDLVQTPKGKTVADHIRNTINNKFRMRCVLEAYDLDSNSTDLLQLADVVAGAINIERRHPATPIKSPKYRVAERLRRALEIDSFDDIQQGKVNILTMKLPTDPCSIA